jgi:hypothetical protein
MSMRRPVVAPLAALALASLVVAWARPPRARVETRGSVFLDRDADGLRDAGEPGLAGIRVSNQDTVVVTDVAGAFRLPSAGHGVAFVTVPSGHRATGPWWRHVDASGAPLAFALAARAPVREFAFVHASDTHVSDASVHRMRRLRALVDSIRPAFALVTGDLVRDALRVPEAEATGYYELFEREARQFATPLHTVPGNHEIFGIERERSKVAADHPLLGKAMYRRFRGPDYYSFDHGGVHFVALNTVDIHDGQWYHGHVDSLQLAWLERDLALVGPTTPVVTFDHIPFYSALEIIHGYSDEPPAPSLITIAGRPTFRHTVSNARVVLAALAARRHVLALGGHVHARERLQYEVEGRPVRFEQSAATVGPSEAGGMKLRSGFTLYRVRDGIIDAGRFVPLDSATRSSTP